MNKKELWLNIANYHFDHLVPANLLDIIVAKFSGEHASLKAFADKLARKLNWDRDFAMKAIWEYKKFVYLGVISDFSVTPSKIIDQVWHEHLLFTNGYRTFCEDVIQYNFAHHPELIPLSSQTNIFKVQYFKTLKLYKAEFGADPPSSIWDDTKFKLKKRIIEKYANDSVMSSSSTSYTNDDTLVSMYPDSNENTFDFSSGDFGGAGASGSWNDSDADSSDSDSGSDGCSSCSSSCGSSCGGD